MSGVADEFTVLEGFAELKSWSPPNVLTADAVRDLPAEIQTIIERDVVAAGFSFATVTAIEYFGGKLASVTVSVLGDG